MPILNYKQYGEALGFLSPFTEAEVREQMKLNYLIEMEKRKRRKQEPKTINLTGAEFIAFCEQFRTLSKTDFMAYRANLYQKQP